MNNTQCRMARAGLKWTAADLAKAAGIGYATVARFESGETVQAAGVEKMRAALVAAGVEFINGGQSVGVRVPRAGTEAERTAQLRTVRASLRKAHRAIRARQVTSHLR